MSHLPLVHASTVLPPPVWALAAADHPGPVPVMAPSGSLLQESEKTRLANMLRHKDLLLDEEHPSSVVSSSVHVPIEAKWEELLTLLGVGYDYLIADPVREQRARDLLQEVCTTTGSIMQSPEFQEKADAFMVDFVKALDVVRMNNDHLLAVNRELTYWHSAQLERTKRLKKLDLRYASYVSKETALHNLEAQRAELERQLAEVIAKETAQRAEVEAMAPSLRQEIQQVGDLEKDLVLSSTQIKVQEQRQREMIGEKSQLEYNLKTFVHLARTLLYSNDK